MHTLSHELRVAVRSLRKRPVFSLVAIASIALGIGFNAAIFSGANALLFSGADVPAAEEAVEVGRTRMGSGFDTFGYPDFLRLREGMTPLRAVAAWRAVPVSWGTDDGGERLSALAVSPAYFEALGVRVVQGRLFGPEADERGGPAVAVVSHQFWLERLGGDPDVVGSVMDINRTPFTVIGVTEPGFDGHWDAFSTHVWVPIARMDLAEPSFDTRLYDHVGSSWLHVLGRLAPGETIQQAQEAADLVMARMAEDYPETHEDRGARVMALGPVPGAGRSLVAGFVGILGGLVILVLLITAANVAGMLLARAASRRQEIAIRLAMGSGRGRLVRQLTAESALLFLVGGGLGAGLAFAGTELLSRVSLPGPEPITLDVSADATVLFFSLGLALLTGIVFGLVPALNASRPDLVPALKSEGSDRSTGGRLRRGFAAGQVGLSLVLMVAAGLFARALQQAGDIDAGFDGTGVETVALDLGLDGYTEDEAAPFQARLVETLGARPGFDAVALAHDLPLDLGASHTAAWPLSFENAEAASVGVDFTVVSHGYFETLRIPVRQGRGFGPEDGANTTPVIVVNQSLADRMWPGQSPLGEQIRFGRPEAEPRTVIGVVADVKNQHLGETVDPSVYVPLSQAPRTDAYVVARGPGVSPATLRAGLLELDPQLTLAVIQGLDEIASLGTLPQRVAAWLSGAMGLLALLLSALGVYGVIAYAVVQRRKELGVRMAIGATRPSIVRLVLRSGVRLALPGLVIGGVVALGASRVLQSLLFGVSPADPLTFGVVLITLGVVVVAASAVPALRAARENPIRSLRSE